MKTSTYTFYEKTIIENIDFDGYGYSNKMYLYDKIKTLYNIFKSEYVHENNKHLNETFLFSEWLIGLPTILAVPFYNGEILENAQINGYKLNTKEAEDIFLAEYWNKLAEAFFTLKENL